MSLSRLLLTAFLSAACLTLNSCKSSGKKGKSNVKMLPINVTSSPTPPRHNLPRGEYPFDARGNYVSEWAVEGEQRAGRRPSYGTDYSSWRSSHSSSSSSRSSSSSSTKKASSSSSKPSTSAVTHTVKSGDTLYGIALRYKSTVAKIKSANGLRSDVIRPGQRLRIPR